ncbi:MAG: hypothetical protein GVY20_09160 [Bacteroidetes bacterium]|jgi:uncharacterized repeat protein (TIGR02543 family)|nr:hypothetical protein [Bacteroidota bacterium]
MKSSHILFYVLLLTVALWSCSTENKKVHKLTVNSEPVEAGTVTPAEGEYDEGAEVSITAAPHNGWIFDKWAGSESGSDNPVSLIMDSDKSLTALFIKQSYPLTVDVEGQGTVNQQVIQNKETDYEHGTTVELTAIAEDGWTFKEWTGDIEDSESITTITIEEKITVTAIFEKKGYNLDISIEGDGTVDEQIIETKKKDYEFGTTVELTANPAEGWIFDGWSGDLSGSENPKEITIDEAKSVTAVFTEGNFTLTVEVSGNGSVNQQEVKNKNTEYKFGSQVELTAVPDTDWEFMEWSGDIEGEQLVREILIDQNKVVNARFSAMPTVTTTSVSSIDVSSAASGGEVTSDGNSEIIRFGVCWSKNQNPTIQDECTTENSDSDFFSTDLQELDSNTYYYVRAYAENEVGVGYGQEEVFQTLSKSWENIGYGIYTSPTNPRADYSSVNAMTEYDGKLIIAGKFKFVDDIETINIAAWDGNAWQKIGGSMNESTGDGGTSVKSLTVYNGDLIAAGWFSKIEDRNIKNIARWDGNNWRPIGNYLDGTVNTLVVFEGRLIAGGFFHDYGNIVQLVNGKWETIAEINEHVGSLEIYNGDLIAGGDFEKIGDKTVNHIARWDGNEWQRISFGFNRSVRSLAVYNGVLIAGGEFTDANGQETNHIARFIGGKWQPLGDGMSSAVHTMTIYDNDLIAGGAFKTAGNMNMNRVARWVGSAWMKMADGFNHYVNSLYTFDGNLYAGGAFTKSGYKEILRIGRWNE